MKMYIKYIFIGLGVIVLIIAISVCLFLNGSIKYHKVLDAYARANVYRNSGQYDKAISEYKSGLLYADGAVALKLKTELANVYFSKGDYLSARQYAEETLKTNENDIKCLSMIGLIEAKVGNSSRAEEIFKRVVKFHPNNYAGYLQLAYIYNNNREYNKAIDNCATAIKCIKDDVGAPAELKADPIKYMGIIYLNAKQHQKAIEYFNKALEVNSNDKEIYGLLAKTYEYEKDSKSAIESWNIVIKLYGPSDGHAKYAQSRLEAIKNGNYLVNE